MSFKELIKKAVMATMPAAAMRHIRRRYYLKLLKEFSMEKNEPLLQVVRLLVNPGDMVVDVGANFGTYTRMLSEWVGDDGRVYSVEPIPATFDVLQSNIRGLRMRNVVAFDCAVCDVEGTVTMEIPTGESGGENYYRAHIASSGAKGTASVQVRAATLDSMLRDLADATTFIKVDVEGAELAVLKGAGEFLKRARPAWLIEIEDAPDKPGSSAQRVFELMRSAGYEAWWYRQGRLHQWQAGQRSMDYFFLQPRHVETLRTRQPDFFA